MAVLMRAGGGAAFRCDPACRWRCGCDLLRDCCSHTLGRWCRVGVTALHGRADTPPPHHTCPVLFELSVSSIARHTERWRCSGMWCRRPSPSPSLCETVSRCGVGPSCLATGLTCTRAATTLCTAQQSVPSRWHRHMATRRGSPSLLLSAGACFRRTLGVYCCAAARTAAVTVRAVYSHERLSQTRVSARQRCPPCVTHLTVLQA